jgi:hypothetical protein
MRPRDDRPSSPSQPWGRVSTIRLETFSDSVFAFVLVCLLVRGELAGGAAIEELVMPKVIRASCAAVLLAVVGGRSAVRVWWARHRRRMTALS